MTSSIEIIVASKFTHFNIYLVSLIKTSKLLQTKCRLGLPVIRLTVEVELLLLNWEKNWHYAVMKFIS